MSRPCRRVDCNMISIPMNRRSRPWRILNLISTTFCIGVCGVFLYPTFYPDTQEIEKELVFFLLYEDSIQGLALMAFWIFSFHFLVYSRFCKIYPEKGLFYYALPFMGRKLYYMVEVRSIQVETDMSEVLLKLKSIKWHRVYLQLHSGKILLLTEEAEESEARAIAERLQEIFHVEIENLQRVGWKRGVELNLGNYTIQKELSHGGMGKVFLALDKRTGEKVAIKVLPASLATEPSYVESFVREIRILQRLSHPGIVKIHSMGRDEGRYGDVYFYAMEFLEGRPLLDCIQKQELTIQRSVEIGIAVAQALHYSHEHRIVHRDVKPSNIMIKNDGTAVLIDFGIAKLTSTKQGHHYCQEGNQEISHYVGTLPYMSPEQLSSEATIDYRTDIYSLGVTLYEMLTFTRAFRGGNQTICRSIVASYPDEPSRLNPLVPRDLDTITMKALEKNKTNRYKSAATLAEDLQRWRDGKPILSKPVGRLARLWRKIRGFFKWIG